MGETRRGHCDGGGMWKGNFDEVGQGLCKAFMERPWWVMSLRTGREGLWLVGCRERDLQSVLSSEYSPFPFLLWMALLRLSLSFSLALTH